MYHLVGYPGNIYSHNMDFLTAYHIQRRIDNSERKLKEERNIGEDIELIKKEKVFYKSPHRDNVCETCGQQLHWCVCSTH